MGKAGMTRTAVSPRVLESHARLAGGGAPELVRRAFGVDLNRWLLTVPLGIDELPATSPEPVGGAGVRFFTPQPGQVRAVEVATEARRVPKGETPPVFLPYLDEFRQLPAAAVIAKSSATPCRSCSPSPTACPDK